MHFNKWYLFLSLISIFLDISLIFIEPLSNIAINQMTRTALRISTNRTNKSKAVFNLKEVKAINTTSVVKSSFTHGDVIGIISMPSIKLKLPIYQGLDNDNLVKRAGIMKPHEQMGTGNYALAGHIS